MKTTSQSINIEAQGSKISIELSDSDNLLISVKNPSGMINFGSSHSEKIEDILQAFKVINTLKPFSQLKSYADIEKLSKEKPLVVRHNNVFDVAKNMEIPYPIDDTIDSLESKIKNNELSDYELMEIRKIIKPKTK